MSIKSIDNSSQKKRSCVLPIAAAAILTVIPSCDAKANNIYERQLMQDTFQLSEEPLIDLKDDGSYKLVNPDYVDTKKYLSSVSAPKKRRTNDKDIYSTADKIIVSMLILWFAKLGLDNYEKTGKIDNSLKND